MISPRRLEKC